MALRNIRKRYRQGGLFSRQCLGKDRISNLALPKIRTQAWNKRFQAVRALDYVPGIYQMAVVFD